LKSRIEFGETTVKKYFDAPAAFSAELDAYQLALPMIPSLIAYQEPDWILCSRIEGIPYLDSVTELDYGLLGTTIAAFHLATWQDGRCLCHIDNQPANILRSSEGFYLIDFSDSRRDFPERDITHQLLFWAADMPQELLLARCNAFLAAYTAVLALLPKLWQTCLSESIAVFDSRRANFQKPGGKNPRDLQIANRHILASFQ
jgi:serine/threonine protein kinase